MSWLFSQALAEEYSEDICLDGEPSVQSNGSHTQQAYCAPDKMTEFSRLSQFGMTFKPLTADRGEELLTLYLEDSLVKTLAQQVKAQELTDSAAECGDTWREWFAKYDPNTFSWKTAQCSLLEGLDEFSETWPKWGSMQNGVCWAQMMLALHTEESASGFWATPTTMDSLPPKSEKALLREATITRLGRSKPSNLRDQVSNLKAWPTPTVNDSKNSTLPLSQIKHDNLPGALLRSGEKPGGQLNPTWVEWLMGWPPGWTDLKPLETGRFRQWQQQHGDYFYLEN